MNFEKFSDYNVAPGNQKKTIRTSPVTDISQDTALKLYTHMLRLRRMQESLIAEYHPADEMRCPMHFCVGQEAVPAALNLTLKDEDFLFSHHRSHGYYFAKVNTMNELFAEFYGKETGANGGKAGSQDVSMTAKRFYSGAILAGGVPLAAGAAFGFQVQKLPYVAVTGFGDGATDEGVLWESVNYAGLKKLPMIFICENNYYSTYSPQHHRSAGTNIAERAASFGVRSQTLLGNDVVNLYKQLKSAVDSVRAGEGPVFIEAFTYRWTPHVGPESDEYVGYRSEEERAHWKALDPIRLIEEKMLAAKWLDESGKKKILDAANREIAEAFKFAKESKFSVDPDLESMNLANRSPLADKVLQDEKSVDFNQNQLEAIPGPY
ncbi:MAG: thiamine pyrophosphate-dependent dehydrogenase E1 component subunit alpha [Bdellovibrionales bacterium]|nr:thiamine pyrophosphate-dependent dehydrogenase E1 component subunit alpha [Bdellovibrionales bacterium]